LHDGRFTLIVSASVDVQDLYVLALRARRRRALAVGSIDAATVAVRCTHVSAVLYDVERTVDWESLAALRRTVEPRMPFVVVSSCVAADRSYRLLARQLGCAAFVAKPCCPSIVVRAVDHAANGGDWTEYEEPADQHGNHPHKACALADTWESADWAQRLRSKT
jgi:DNA-binding NarL/FixJ family response regulator